MAELFDIMTYDFAEDDSVSTPALLNIVTKTSDRTNTPTDDPTGYTPLLSATSIVSRPAGVYEFGFSINWNLDAANKTALIAYSRDGGTVWTVSPKEPKDGADRNLTAYVFPHTTVSDEILTFDVQITMFDGSITTESIDVFFCNAWIKRVG